MDRDERRRLRREADEMRIRRISPPQLGAAALAKLHARRYDPAHPDALTRHMPGKHDQLKHGGGRAGALLDALKKLIPDDQIGGAALDFGDGRYFDWSTSTGPGVTSWEIAGDDGESIQFDLSDDDMQQLSSSLAVSLLRDSAPPPDPTDRQSVLLASLLHTGQHGHAPFGDNEDIDETGRFFDWSSRGVDGSYQLEVGADGDAITMELTPDEMAQFHAQLVRSLLASDVPDEARSARRRRRSP